MERFVPGAIVWAKFEDHPYWPGRVASSSVTAHLVAYKGYEGVGVLFFGESLTYALVPLNNVELFADNAKYLKQSFGKNFKKAVEMAQNNKCFEDPPLVITHRKKASHHTKMHLAHGVAGSESGL